MARNRVEIIAALRDAFSPQAKKMSRSIDDVGRNLEKTSKGASKTNRAFRSLMGAGRIVTKVFGGIANTLKTIVKSFITLPGLIAAAAAGFLLFKTGQFFASFITQAMQVQKLVAEIGTLLGETVIGNLSDLSRQIRAVAVEGGQDFESAFKGAYNAISAGVSAKQLISFLTLANKTAIGGVTDMNTAVDLLTSVVNAFGEEFESTERFADALFTTVRLGKTTINELARSIGFAAPQAAAAGMSIEELGGAVATLTANGLRTQIAMTRLNAIFRFILKPTKKAREVAKEYGITLDLVKIQTMGWAEWIGSVNKAFKGNIEAMSQMFPGMQQLSAFLILGRDNAKKYKENMIGMADGTGAVTTAFELMNQTLDQAANRFKAFWMDIKTDIGNIFIPAITAALNAVTDIGSTVKGKMQGALGGLSQIMAKEQSTPGSVPPAQLKKASDLFDELLKKSIGLLGSIFSRVLGALYDVIIAGVKTAASFIIPALSDGITDALSHATGGALAMSVRSKRQEHIDTRSGLEAELKGDTTRAQRLRIVEKIRLVQADIAGGNELILAQEAKYLEMRLEALGLLEGSQEALSNIVGDMKDSDQWSEWLGALEKAEELTESLREKKTLQQIVDEAITESTKLYNAQLKEANERAEEAALLAKAKEESEKRAAEIADRKLALDRATLEIRELVLLEEKELANLKQKQLDLATFEASLHTAEGDSNTALIQQERDLLNLAIEKAEMQLKINGGMKDFVSLQDAYKLRLEEIRTLEQTGVMTKTTAAQATIAAQIMFNEAVDTHISLLRSMIETYGVEWAPMIDILIEKMEKLKGIQNEITDVNKAQEFFDNFKAGLGDVKFELNTIANVMGSRLGQAIDDVIDGTKDWATAMKDAALGMIQDLIKIIIKEQILLMLRIAMKALSYGLANSGGLIAGDGKVSHFSAGGNVGGRGPDRDSVPAMLTPGEYVLRRKAVDHYGVGFMQALNRMLVPKSDLAFGASNLHRGKGFNTGGQVPRDAAGPQSMPTGPAPAVIVSNESNMQSMLDGGSSVMIDFLRANRDSFMGDSRLIR